MRRYLVVIALFLSVFSLAQTEQEILKKVLVATSNMKTMSTDFVQEKHLEILDEMVVSKGQLYMKQPNLVSWIYTTPTTFQILITETKTFIKTENGLNEFDNSSNQMFKLINELITQTFSGEIINRTDFTKKAYVEGEFYRVDMKPTKGEIVDYMQTVSIYFNKTSLAMTKVKMTEPEGDYTNIKFVNLKVNGTIDDQVFKIK